MVHPRLGQNLVHPTGLPHTPPPKSFGVQVTAGRPQAPLASFFHMVITHTAVNSPTEVWAALPSRHLGETFFLGKGIWTLGLEMGGEGDPGGPLRGLAGGAQGA